MKTYRKKKYLLLTFGLVVLILLVANRHNYNKYFKSNNSEISSVYQDSFILSPTHLLFLKNTTNGHIYSVNLLDVAGKYRAKFELKRHKPDDISVKDKEVFNLYDFGIFIRTGKKEFVYYTFVSNSIINFQGVSMLWMPGQNHLLHLGGDYLYTILDVNDYSDLSYKEIEWKEFNDIEAGSYIHYK